MAFNMHDGGILLLQKVKNSTCKCYFTCIFKELNFIGLCIIFTLYSIKSMSLEYAIIDKKKIDTSIT